jgi:hypothetical protein
MRAIDAINSYGKLVMIEQSELAYGVTWDDANALCKIIELPCNLKSDNYDEDDFEEVIWEAEVDNIKIRDTTVYGIGAFTVLEKI